MLETVVGYKGGDASLSLRYRNHKICFRCCYKTKSSLTILGGKTSNKITCFTNKRCLLGNLVEDYPFNNHSSYKSQSTGSFEKVLSPKSVLSSRADQTLKLCYSKDSKFFHVARQYSKSPTVRNRSL